MPEAKLPDAGITFDGILYVVALIVAVAGVLVAIVKGWEAFRKISVRDRVKDLEGRMDKVEARLSLGDKRFELQSDDLGHMLNTQMAMMMHFYSGNDHARLRDQITTLTEYMTQRTAKAEAYLAERDRLMQNNGNGGQNA
jgi:hypothetical protein